MTSEMTHAVGKIANNEWLVLGQRIGLILLTAAAGYYFFLEGEERRTAEVHRMMNWQQEEKIKTLQTQADSLRSDLVAIGLSRSEFQNNVIERLSGVETEIKGFRNDMNRVMNRLYPESREVR